MKRSAFLVSHLGADFHRLATILESTSRIHVFDTGTSYRHHDDVRRLVAMQHRDERSNSIWMDILIHNTSLTNRDLLCRSPIVCLIEDPVTALPRIMHTGYAPASASLYYRFRCRGIWEHALRNRAPVLSHEPWDLRRIESHLGLKKNSLSDTSSAAAIESEVPTLFVQDCRRTYDHYVASLRKHGLLAIAAESAS